MQKRRVRGCVCPPAESIKVSLDPEVFIIRCQQDSTAFINQIADITFLLFSLLT